MSRQCKWLNGLATGNNKQRKIEEKIHPSNKNTNQFDCKRCTSMCNSSQHNSIQWHFFWYTNIVAKHVQYLFDSATTSLQSNPFQFYSILWFNTISVQFYHFRSLIYYIFYFSGGWMVAIIIIISTKRQPHTEK